MNRYLTTVSVVKSELSYQSLQQGQMDVQAMHPWHGYSRAIEDGVRNYFNLEELELQSIVPLPSAVDGSSSTLIESSTSKERYSMCAGIPEHA